MIRIFGNPESLVPLCGVAASIQAHKARFVLSLVLACSATFASAAQTCPKLLRSEQTICLQSPDGSPGDIYLRDEAGRRQSTSWPDRSAVYLSRYSVDCRLGEVTNDAGDKAWVSSIVIKPAANCASSTLPPDPITPTEPTNPVEPSTPPEEPNIPVPHEDLPADYYDYQTVYNFSGAIASCSIQTSCKAVLKNYAAQGAHIGSYDWAREMLFQEIDGHVDSVGHWVATSVYTLHDMLLPKNRIPTSTIVNVEHTFPQSKLKAGKWFNRSKADLMHLFPTESTVNSTRGNEPFANCSGNGQDWVKCSAGFEPPHVHKGVVARAMFYMAISYDLTIPKAEEDVLRSWAARYPVTSSEMLRLHRVFLVQGNRNPFIDHPDWINLISDY